MLNFQNLKNKFIGSDKTDKKAINIAAIVIAAIIVLAAGNGLSSHGKKVPAQNTNATSSLALDMKLYSETLEKRLEHGLSKVNGAGKVDVILTMKNGVEKVLAQDIKLNEQKEMDENSNGSKKTSDSFTKDSKAIMHGKQSSGEQPVVLKETFPKVLGVLVICEGANNKEVAKELHASVKAVLEVPSHRIKIVERKK